MVLSQKFFNQPTIQAAKNLLGKFLVRRYRGNNIAVIVTEVEAYDGPHDLASHASRGIGERNKVMFGEAGCFYVYFTYGMHWMLNIVTGPKNYPAAVLIRAGIVFTKNGNKKILNGPAKLTKHLKIGKRFNGRIANKKTGLWLEDRGINIKPSQIIARKRIGVDYAGRWAKKPYNFSI